MANDKKSVKATRICQRRHLISQMTTERAWRDSNPRPSGPEPDALSTELHALVL